MYSGMKDLERQMEERQMVEDMYKMEKQIMAELRQKSADREAMKNSPTPSTILSPYPPAQYSPKAPTAPELADEKKEDKETKAVEPPKKDKGLFYAFMCCCRPESEKRYASAKVKPK